MSTLIIVSLIFTFSVIWTLDYPDYLLKSQRVQIIEVQLYYSDLQFLNIFFVWPYTYVQFVLKAWGKLELDIVQ